MSEKEFEYISKKQGKKRLGSPSDASIWRWMQSGILPPLRQVGPNRVSWVLHEFNQALENFPIAGGKVVCPGAKRGRKPKNKGVANNEV